MKTLILVLACYVGDAWPGFLGAGAKIQSPGQVPVTWSPTESMAWTAEVAGYGQSSPLIMDGKVFVTAIDGPKKETNKIVCFDLATGKQLWSNDTPSSFPVENSVYVSRAAPTPVVDAARIVSFFESGDIVAVDLQGKELWKRSLGKEYGEFKNKFGLSGSLVQDEKHVFVLVDDEGPSYLLAIDKATGANVWKKDRTSRTSWSSPTIVQIGGKPHIVVSSAGSIDGYDPSTGNVLWSYSDVGGNTGTTPIDAGEGRFLIAASGGQDGKNSEMAKKSNFLMTVSPKGTSFDVQPKWFTREATPSWASPVLYRDCAYWINRTGVVFCYDAATGNLNYSERLKQSCWATPVGIEDRVYFFGKDGLTSVIAAGPTFKLLSENEFFDPNSMKADPKAGEKEPTEERRRAAAMFSGPTLYGVAIADGSLVARIGNKVFCVRK